MIVLTLVFLAFFTFYIYVKHCHSYWKKRKIPTPQPTFFAGNIWDTLLGRKNFMVPVIEAYNSFKDYKYIGFYKCLSPTLIINDPELIGQILVKDFNHFEDNSVEVSENVDCLAARNLFFMKGYHWRSIKALISPMFTPGKLKHVLPLMNGTAEKLVAHITKHIQNGNNHGVDGKYLAHQFSTENVANCAFGLDAQAFERDNSQFVEAVRKFASPSFIQALKVNLMFMLPSFSKLLSVSFFPKSVQDYLIDIVSQTLRYRQENQIKRNDFLDMFGQLKEQSKAFPFNDKDVTAQAAGFFGNGIETSSTLLAYTLFELGKHAEVQDKVRDEIESIKKQYNNELSYAAIMDMNYLDCVISETLRIDTNLMVLFKSCTKAYQLPPSKANLPSVWVNPGDTILIPIEGLHRNDQYFENADQFIPERFSKENKDNIINYTYLPFGEGPRYCVGMRFGILQVKTALVHILLNFQVSLNEKMKRNPGLNPGTFMRMPDCGFWFDFELLEDNKM